MNASIVGPDAIARRFGAMVHLDHIAVEPKSEAYKAARAALTCTTSGRASAWPTPAIAVGMNQSWILRIHTTMIFQW